MAIARGVGVQKSRMVGGGVYTGVRAERGRVEIRENSKIEGCIIKALSPTSLYLLVLIQAHSPVEALCHLEYLWRE